LAVWPIAAARDGAKRIKLPSAGVSWVGCGAARRVYTTPLSRRLNADPRSVLKYCFEPVTFYKGMRDTVPSTNPHDPGPGDQDPKMMGGMMKK
jgi:hypothetical protein